jgi:hypothetical protein
MSKRTVFTTISPLPAGITREVVIDFLHNHLEMIDLNPLVKERHPIKPPAHATPEEFHCIWYSLTDKVSYLPGGLAAGDVSYTCAFHDLANGLQTHCYAPMGLDIRDKWTLGGSLPGEPVEAVELGIGAPLTGLYIREDIDMRCNLLMSAFVKKTLKKAHGTLVDRLKVKAQIATAAELNHRMSISHSVTSSAGSWQSQTPPLTHQNSFPTPMANPPHFPHQSHPGSGGYLQGQQPGRRGSPPYQHGVPVPPVDAAQGTPQPGFAYSEPLRPTYRDAQGRVTWQALKPSPSMASRYSTASGSDYSDIAQANPYGGDNQQHGELQSSYNPRHAINGYDNKGPQHQQQGRQHFAELE